MFRTRKRIRKIRTSRSEFSGKLKHSPGSTTNTKSGAALGGGCGHGGGGRGTARWLIGSARLLTQSLTHSLTQSIVHRCALQRKTETQRERESREREQRKSRRRFPRNGEWRRETPPKKHVDSGENGPKQRVSCHEEQQLERQQQPWTWNTMMITKYGRRRLECLLLQVKSSL